MTCFLRLSNSLGTENIYCITYYATLVGKLSQAAYDSSNTIHKITLLLDKTL